MSSALYIDVCIDCLRRAVVLIGPFAIIVVIFVLCAFYSWKFMQFTVSLLAFRLVFNKLELSWVDIATVYMANKASCDNNRLNVRGWQGSNQIHSPASAWSRVHRSLLHPWQPRLPRCSKQQCVQKAPSGEKEQQQTFSVCRSSQVDYQVVSVRQTQSTARKR